MLVLQLAEHIFVGQSTIGISLFKLETPYADPHVRCCERCDAKTSAYSILNAQQTNLKQAEQPSQLVLHPAPGVHNSLQQGRAVIVRAASPVLENANWIFSLLCRPFVLSGISEPPFPYGTETCVQEIFLS